MSLRDTSILVSSSFIVYIYSVFGGPVFVAVVVRSLCLPWTSRGTLGSLSYDLIHARRDDTQQQMKYRMHVPAFCPDVARDRTNGVFLACFCFFFTSRRVQTCLLSLIVDMLAFACAGESNSIYWGHDRFPHLHFPVRIISNKTQCPAWSYSTFWTGDVPRKGRNIWYLLISVFPATLMIPLYRFWSLRAPRTWVYKKIQIQKTLHTTCCLLVVVCVPTQQFNNIV